MKEKQPNITFLIGSMSAGGAEKVALLLMNELISRNWDVTLIVARGEGEYFRRVDKRIEIVVLKSQKISQNISEIAKYLRNEKPQVFHSSMMYINVIAGIAAITSNYRGRLIFSDHSHPSSVLQTQGNLKVRLISKLAKLIYKRASGVICVSNGIKDDLMSLFSSLPPLHVINKPVEIINYNLPPYHRNTFSIVSVGRLDKDKNFELLIHVA